MTSKFFATGDSDSDTDESVSGDEGGKVADQNAQSQRFVYDSSSEEEEKRVVRTAKEKRYEELQTTIKSMKNHLKISDWVSVTKDFDNLLKQLDKTKKSLKTTVSPPFFIKVLLDLDNQVKAQLEKKDDTKKLNATNAKALNAMKSKMRKTTKDFEKEIANYQKNPIASDEESDSGKKKKKKQAKAKKSDSEEEEDKEDKKESKDQSEEDKEDEDEDEEEEGDSEAEKEEKKPAKKAAKKESESEEEESEEEEGDEEEKPKKKPAKKAKSSDEEDDDEEEESDEDEDSEEGSEDEESEDEKPKKKTAKKAKSSDDDDDDDEEEDEDDEDDEEEEKDEDDKNDDDDDVNLEAEAGPQFSRDFWVKKEFKKGYTGEKDKDRDDDRRKRIVRTQGQGKKARDSDEEDEPKKKPVEEVKEYTEETITKRLRELMALRGKRIGAADRNKMLDELRVLAVKSTNPLLALRVRVALCAALFDFSLGNALFMPVEIWTQCYDSVLDLIDLLTKHDNVRLSEDDEAQEGFEEEMESMMAVAGVTEMDDEMRARLDAIAKKRREEQEAARLKMESQDGGRKYVSGNLFSFVHKLIGEYRKSLQNIDPNTPEYIKRLTDEPNCLSLTSKAQLYYTKIGKTHYLARVMLQRMEFLYYHYHPERAALKQVKAKLEQEEKEKEKEKAAKPKPRFVVNLTKVGPAAMNEARDPRDPVHEIAAFLYKNGDAKQKIRALLFEVYYLSLHNHYAAARDLLLMSRVQDGINEADVKSRILFNRAMAQIGLCAFRVGDTRSALYALADLHQSNRIKELIAQGTSSRFNEKEGEKEKLERRKYPYHMHINLDMLESVHLMSAMFVEVPNVALNGYDKRKIISKAFRRFLENHQRQAFNGPPENTRDTVMAASKALQTGDWEKCYSLLRSLRMWAIMPHSDVVLQSLLAQVKTLALKTYLLAYGNQYKSVSLASLVSLFALPRQTVYQVCTKMMYKRQLAGAWDQPSDCILMHGKHKTPLQRAAFEFLDKNASFVEQHERLVEQKFGYFTKPERGERGGHHGEKSQNQQGGGERTNAADRMGRLWVDYSAMSSSYTTFSSYGSAATSSFSGSNYGRSYDNYRKARKEAEGA